MGVQFNPISTCRVFYSSGLSPGKLCLSSPIES
jgi:hypothetical protein